MRALRSLTFVLALGMVPACLMTVSGHAQQNDARQRAYQAGYQNGVSDRERNRTENTRTDDWRGENLEAYQQGYEAGYRGAARGDNRGYGRDGDDNRGAYSSGGQYSNNDAHQRAYQAGYQKGVSDRQRGRSLNPRTDDWHGENLETYRQGYQDGYRRAGEEQPQRHPDDDDSH